MNMYVSNLSFKVQENDLAELFGAYGEVVSAKIITDRETGRSRGFGFVEMSSDEAGNKAMAELNNRDFEGRPLNVSLAKEKTDRPSRNRW
jgi:RNA recognition motif-containing protein